MRVINILKCLDLFHIWKLHTYYTLLFHQACYWVLLEWSCYQGSFYPASLYKPQTQNPQHHPNVYFSTWYFSKKKINTYLMLEIRVVCRVFLAFKYVFVVFFLSKQLRWLFIFRNLENSRLKSGFRYTISISFVWTGREY